MSKLDTNKPAKNDPLFQAPTQLRQDAIIINDAITNQHNVSGNHLLNAPKLLRQSGTSGLTPNLNNLVYDTSLQRIWFYGYDANNLGPKWILLPHSKMFSGSTLFIIPSIMAGGTLYTLKNNFNDGSIPTPKLHISLPNGLSTYPTILCFINCTMRGLCSSTGHDFLVENADGTAWNSPSTANFDQVTLLFTPDNNKTFWTIPINRTNDGTYTYFTASATFMIDWQNFDLTKWVLYMTVNPAQQFTSMPPRFILAYAVPSVNVKIDMAII